MLDEECLRPGKVNEETFLNKLNQVFVKHQRYESRVTQNAKRIMDASLPVNCFRIQHYAGKASSVGGLSQFLEAKKEEKRKTIVCGDVGHISPAF